MTGTSFVSSGGPKGWDLVPLDDLRAPGSYTLVGEPFGSNLTRDDYVDTPGVPVIRGVNLGGKDSRFIDDDFVYVNELKADSLAQNLAHPGDLVFTQRGTLGQVAIIPVSARFPRYLLSQRQMKLKVNAGRSDARYLYHYFRSPIAIAHLNTRVLTTGVPHINLAILKEFPVSLPPLPEQRRIADILDKADAIRCKRQEAIRLTEDLLRSVFLDMFGDPVTNPMGWPVVKLGEIAEDLRYGTSAKCTSAGDGFPVLRIPNVIGGIISTEELKYARLSSQEISKLKLTPGDLLFVRSNGNPEYIGRCAVYDSAAEMLFASYLIRARLSETAQCRPKFVQQVVSFPTYRTILVPEARTTAGNYNINTQGLRRLRIIAPPVELQNVYLAFLGQSMASGDRLRASAAADGTLFRSLAQCAFRGEL